MKKICIIVVLCMITSHLVGQDMYKALQSEHGRLRFGAGVQLFEPTGITLQAFHGFFCSNSDSYATYGVVELGLGIENVLLTTENKSYKTGFWQSGGFRAELNYLYPFLTIEPSFAAQFYLGAGLQTGTRKYGVPGLPEESTSATGYNLMFRFEVIGQGKTVGRSILFVSFYADLKFHSDFGESFNYFKPSFGIRVRKGR